MGTDSGGECTTMLIPDHITITHAVDVQNWPFLVSAYLVGVFSAWMLQVTLKK
jgi:hypothetical protein